MGEKLLFALIGSAAVQNQNVGGGGKTSRIPRVQQEKGGAALPKKPALHGTAGTLGQVE